MTEFKARMPRWKPVKGEAFVVLSVKDLNGTRMEMTGIIPHDLAMEMLRMSVEARVRKPNVQHLPSDDTEGGGL